MEVEAKFCLPDRDAFERIQKTTRLAGFPVAKGQARTEDDTYMDTAGRKILSGGFVCRFRRGAEGLRITLKGLGGVAGAIHRREEMEILLPAVLPPEAWPAGPVRQQVLALTAGEALLPLVELHQVRITRPVHDQGQTIAELSLDEVHGMVGDRQQAYYELEVELTSQGSEEQLVAIADSLQQKWELHPEPLSKFERALALLDFQPAPQPPAGDVLETLTRIAERPGWHGLRARALLALEQGLSVGEASRQLGRSRWTIHRWWTVYRASSLAIFPAAILEDAAHPAVLPDTGVPVIESPRVSISVPVPPAPQIKLPEKPGIQADDVMADVVRKTLYFQFQRMLYHEPGTLAGQDIEELHDMRVATRRMRAALLVFSDYLDHEKWEPFEKGLRRTGRTLGIVRDMDVFWEKTQLYLDSLPPERREELAPLHAVWQVQRDRARERMISYLQSNHHLQFKDSFTRFLETAEPGAAPAFNLAGEPQPRRLRHVAPVILYQRLAAMRAFDEWIIGPDVPLARLHQLRIASKGLRYAFEFLEEVLGEQTRDLIKEIKALQDHLGNLQDAVVASNILRDFLTWGTWGHDTTKKALPVPAAPVVAPGVAIYLAVRQAELQTLPATFPPIWAHIQGTEFKQNLAAALAGL